MTRRGTPASLGAADPVRLADHVVAHLRTLIEEGHYRPGDRLPGERDLAQQLGVSRPSVRAGLQALTAMGIVTSQRGSGTFITDGPPALASEGLRLQAALHGIGRGDMFEARRLLEVGIARLAAERAGGDQIAGLSEEVMEMFASTGDPQRFLLHDIRFHRAIGRASSNPVLAAFVEMVSELFYEQRRATIERDRDLGVAADSHRQIYQAIRDHDPQLAGELMEVHLRDAQHMQDLEEHDGGASATEARRRRRAAGRRG